MVRPADRQAHPPRRPQVREGPGGRHHRADRHLEREPTPFTWTKTADEILNSLADYLTKVGTISQKTKQD